MRFARRLGRGSIFEVTLVFDEQGRELICKRCTASARLAAGEAALDREREVLMIAKSVHAPEVVASGADAHGAFVLQTQAAGAPVRTLLREAGIASAETWLELARASTKALADLHALRDPVGPLALVHGDISPDNVFFEAPGGIVFVDWSAASWRGAPKPVFSGDRGTLPYAAPELARAEIPADAGCDTYALAATLLAAAVGPGIVDSATDASRLLEVGSRGVRSERMHERRDLPERARSAVTSALSFERASRLVSARELAELLENT